jgi:hypothetical protein
MTALVKVLDRAGETGSELHLVMQRRHDVGIE